LSEIPLIRPGTRRYGPLAGARIDRVARAVHRSIEPTPVQEAGVTVEKLWPIRDRLRIVGEARRAGRPCVANASGADVLPGVVDTANMAHRAKRGAVRRRRQVEVAAYIEQRIGPMRRVVDRRPYDYPAIADRAGGAFARCIAAAIGGGRIYVEGQATGPSDAAVLIADIGEMQLKVMRLARAARLCFAVAE